MIIKETKPESPKEFAKRLSSQVKFGSSAIDGHTWINLSTTDRDHIVTLLERMDDPRPARNAALEEAAKVCDERVDPQRYSVDGAVMAQDCAARIRALKEEA